MHAPQSVALAASPSLFASVRQLLTTMSHRRRRQFFLVLALMIAGASAEVITIGAVFPLLAVLTEPSRINDLPLLMQVLMFFGARQPSDILYYLVALFVLAVVVAAVIRLLLTRTTYSFVFGFGHDLSVETQRRILSQPYSYHVAHNSSDVVSSLEKIQVLVFNVLLQGMQAAIAAVISVLIVAALVFIDAFSATIAAVAFCLLYLGVSLITHKRLKANSDAIGTSYAARVQIVQESLGGIRDIILDDARDVFVDAFKNADRRLAVARASTNFLGAAPRFIIEAAGAALIAALALIVSQREGGLAGALPILGALAFGAQRLLPLVQQVFLGWTFARGNWSTVADVLRLLSLPMSRHFEADPDREPLPFRSEIRLNDVCFTYPGRSAPAVVGIDLRIPRGSRVALIGETGSGKSTLADLIMGLLVPDSGCITVDGISLSEVTRRTWKRCIAHVPQSVFLADTTIARNIALSSSDEHLDINRIAEAARRAQMHSFIDTLPEGYDTVVGERGIRLSGGQRQRLGIARAIYKQAPVLVLDEATSALDDATEAAVMNALDSLGHEGRTIIMIAHRLTTIASSDIVARLHNGRVVELGSFQDVVGNTPDFESL